MYNGRKSLELTGAITALANAIAARLNVDEIALLSAVLVQLGDTLATVATQESLLGTVSGCEG